MRKVISKNYLLAILALLLLSTTSSSLMAQDCCYNSGNRFYFGAFGGEFWSNKSRLIQRGTAFFPEAQGGPLEVDARGKSRSSSAGFAGAQIGYEWTQCPWDFGCAGWNISPAVELEAYWFHHRRKGHLFNDTNRMPEHDFKNSFPLSVGVYLVNGVLSLNNCYWSRLTPYIGGGIGAAHISIRHARSKQLAPLERGINHFNSDRSDTSWAFAAQAKAGLRLRVWDRVNIFGEYRFLYVDSSQFILGSTRYPNHAPTSPWNIDIRHNNYNGFAFGIQIDL